MKEILFGAGLALELVYAGLFWLTLKRPGFRFWPPPHACSWQFILAWFLAGVVAAIFLYLGLLDFNGAFLPAFFSRLPAALACFLLGAGIGFWGSFHFGLRATLGLGDRLVTSGPYRFTRNPQYIGDSLNILGYMLLTNTWLVWVLGIAGILLNYLAPFTEEPWLEQRFGQEYLEYRRQVPRFLGLPRKVNPIHDG